MESVPDGSAIATPGHSLRDYIRIGSWLREQGLNTPQIYAADEATGYLLIEDFGNLSFRRALDEGKDTQALYALAVDALAHIARADTASLSLPNYYDSHVHRGRVRVVDWYIPVLRGRKNPDGLPASYLAAWDAVEKSLPPCPQGFVHVDYHVENLMWVPEREGLASCGILDFQGAMTGPRPYDLANLLEDARYEIAPDLRAAMLERFTQSLAPADKQNFLDWYRVLAAQFHCRVIGQFIRLAVRDGKTRYLPFLPRLAGYLREELNAPVLAPVKAWFSAEGVDFSGIPAIDPVAARALIRDDAF